MSDRQITFEMLNTYVDGELDAAAAAEIARAIAEDPVLAREVVALSRLRSAVVESAEAPPLSVPAPPSHFGRGRVIAASVAIAAVLLVAIGTVLVSTLDRDSSTDWLARAWQIHRGWSIEDKLARARAPNLVAQFAAAVPGVYVPDLSASKLALVHVTTMPLMAGRQALLAGYRGTRGCKISLLVFPSAGALGEALSPFRDAGNEAYGWRAGALGYVILSDGMESSRFALLATSVRLTSRQHVPFDEKTRIALRESRDKSAPCTA